MAVPLPTNCCQVIANWLTTKSIVRKINYRWEISSFEHSGVGWTTKIYSYETPSYYWKLDMVTDDDGFLCVKIRECENNRQWSVVDSNTQAALDVCICDANNTEVRGVGLTEVPYQFVMVADGLRTKLIRRNVLVKNPDRYLPDGDLTVLCTLYYLGRKTYAADRLKEPVPVIPQPEIASSAMRNVLAEGQFSDVVVVAEEREFPVHRVILAQRSDVFRAMFAVDMTETQNKRVVIEDLSADTVSDLLTFIYTDSAPNVNKLAMELLAAAEKYNIPRLKAVCEAKLAKSLNIDNVIDRLLESETYRADQLKTAALHWIGKHAPDVVETTSWKSLCEEHPAWVTVICEQFASYIKHLKCSVSTEN